MNGNGKIVWWLMGMLASVVTGAGGAWCSSMHALTRVHGEKIAVLESQMADQKRQLDRMDRKLDHLLEQTKGDR